MGIGRSWSLHSIKQKLHFALSCLLQAPIYVSWLWREKRSCMRRTPQDNSFSKRVDAFSSALDVCIPACPALMSLQGQALPWHGFSCLSPGMLRASRPWAAFPGLFILPDCNSMGCGAGLFPSMGLPCKSDSKDVLVSLHLN